MIATAPLPFLKLLANDLRWEIIQQLVQTDARVNELVDVLDQPMNLVSYHLKKLREGGIVTARRSAADGRDIYYSLNMDAVQNLYHSTGSAIHPALNHMPKSVSEGSVRVLFVCLHHTAASQLAEAILCHMRNQRFEAFSAGAHPLSMPEEAVQVMQEIGTDFMPRPATAITDYTGQSFDYVITVCDHVRDTHIPVEVTGRRLHWGYRDLNTLPDSETRLQVFREAAQHFQTRISYFMEEV